MFIGFDQGVISLILTMSQFHEAFPEQHPAMLDKASMLDS